MMGCCWFAWLCSDFAAGWRVCRSLAFSKLVVCRLCNIILRLSEIQELGELSAHHRLESPLIRIGHSSSRVTLIQSQVLRPLALLAYAM
ncbi:uncharacterized protein BDZ83DRAFT_623079 [Colletotrichum acutatum]|uniref:Secreted protein n=1 Tax=Glomerella acutata TaxID=27357 RepID=A0AAD8XI99_GLOAC|nr:uncharacterized protein BDZ83DRAFT_623079 [Colletotrichum acutatum]KAK1724395.1 hypothetical protein BDZ83DRAFT_623079 [Colletotrichum acutatum]